LLAFSLILLELYFKSEKKPVHGQSQKY
jgi:hypothetical protein